MLRGTRTGTGTRARAVVDEIHTFDPAKPLHRAELKLPGTGYRYGYPKNTVVILSVFPAVCKFSRLTVLTASLLTPNNGLLIATVVLNCFRAAMEWRRPRCLNPAWVSGAVSVLCV